MTLEEIKDYIREYLVNKSGLNDNQVIFDFQNAPKPSQDFIILNPSLAIRNISNDEKINNTDGTITSTQRKEIDMSINCYGSNSESIMNDVLDSLFLPDSIQDFNLNDIVVFSDSSIRNLSFIENNQWVKRFQLDLRVRFIKETTQDLGYFDTITITTELDTDKVIEHYDTLSISLEREENTNEVKNSVIETTLEREENTNEVKLNIIETTLSHDINTSYTSRPIVNLDIDLDSLLENTETQTVLGTVSNVEFTNISDDSFTITWTNPLDTAQYIILLSLNNFDTVLDLVSGLGNTYTFNGLDSNTTYYLKIHSVSSLGNSQGVTVTTNTKPVAPTIQNATDITTTSFVANWTLPSGITQVKLDVSLDNFDTFIINNLIVTGPSYNVTDLTANTNYKYRVRSIGLSFDSDNSITQNVTTYSFNRDYVTDINTLLYYRGQDGLGTNINDETVNNRDGVIIGTPLWQSGIISGDSYSLKLNGSSNISTNNFTPALTDFTARISFRFETGDKLAKSTHILISRYDTFTGSATITGADFIGEYDSSSNKLLFTIYQANGVFRVFEASYNLLENTNYDIHFAFKLNNSGSNLFQIRVNGIAQTTTLNSQNISNIASVQNSNIPFLIGAYRTAVNTYYRGQFKLLRVALDNRFRTESESLTDYNNLFN